MLTLPRNHLPDEAINPYASPQSDEPVRERGLPPLRHGFALRSFMYLLAGLVLYLAFCSPLDVVFGEGFRRDWQTDRVPVHFLAVVASSLIAGWIFDPLVRMKVPTGITGLGYLLVNSMLFVFFGMCLEGYERANLLNELPGAVLASVILGPIGCLLCVHFVAPICFGAIYLAGELVDDSRPVEAREPVAFRDGRGV